MGRHWFGRSLGSRIWRQPEADEVDGEIAFHLEMRAREYAERGMDPETARRAALARFGDLGQVRARCRRDAAARNRRSHRAEWFADLGLDLRAAVRQVVRQRVFAVVAIITLALGIGANAAMFDLADRLLLSAPPYITDPDRVVRLRFVFENGRFGTFTMTTGSYPAFTNLAGHATSFASMAAVAPGSVVLGRGDEAVQVAAERVTGGYFTLLGVKPALGRVITPDDDRPPSGSPVIVLGYDLWRRRFASDPGVLGRSIDIDGASHAVVGVAPPGFTGADIAPVDVWVPIHDGLAADPGWKTDEGRNLVWTIGRLGTGVSVAMAAEDATLVHRRAFGGWTAPDPRVTLASLIPGRGPDGRTPDATIALWLAGVAGVFFVIAVANVSTLLLLRSVDRRREVAVRLAIGGGRLRILRQLIVEGLVLATLGAIAGLIVARWASEVVRRVLMPNLAAHDLWSQPRVLALAAASALIAGLVTGLAPSSRLRAPAITADLGERAGLRRSRARTALVVLQTALSVLLLVGAGLFLRSLHNVTTQDLGFAPERLLLAELEFPTPTLAAVRRDAYERALDAVSTLPGVDVAVPVQSLPFAGHLVLPVSVPERAEAPTIQGQLPFLTAAAPRFFDVMGMRMIEGRTFTAADGLGPLVTIVNETMARWAWPERGALGRCVRTGFPEGWSGPRASDTLPCRTVVGVVSDTRRRSIRPGDEVMQFYVPFEQLPVPESRPGPQPVWGLLLRVSGNPDSRVGAVERAMRMAAGEGTSHARVQPFTRLLDPQIRPWRLGATMFSVFGALALAMAAVGLYGVMAYAVAQRSQEMGIRLALGASRGAVVRLVFGEGLRLSAAGFAAGTGLALAEGRYLASQLFGVAPADPDVFIAVILTLSAASTLATIVPALRAARLDPTRTLRAE